VEYSQTTKESYLLTNKTRLIMKKIFTLIFSFCHRFVIVLETIAKKIENCGRKSWKFQILCLHL